MKYTLSTPSDKILVEIDHIQTVEATQWSFFVLENNKKLRSSNIETKVSGHQWVLQQGPARSIYLGKATIEKNEFKVATPLGSMDFLLERGIKSSASTANADKNKTVKSSIPGKIIKIFCKPGQTVKFGEPLLILEAMKMENEICAPTDGIVEVLSVSEGQSIESGTILVKLGEKTK